MNFLFYVEPLIEKSNPYWKEYWLNTRVACIVNGIVEDSNNDFVVAVNEPLAEVINFPATVVVFSQQELLEPFLDYLEASIKWYQHTYSNEEMQYYQSLIKGKLGEFIPDVIITFSPVPFLAKVYPEALILHHEFGFFSRLPYPLTCFFDPCGMSEFSFINQFHHVITRNDLTEKDMKYIRLLKNTCYEVIAEKNPFQEVIASIAVKFDLLVLLPLQDSGYYSFDGIVKFRSQYDYLTFVLEHLPANIGVIVTMHPEYPVLNKGAIKFLSNKYNNFIYFDIFEDYYAASQYIIPYVDAVITVSSSVGLQAILFDKPVFAIGDCFKFIAKKFDGAPLDLSVDQEYYNRILHWIITHYLLQEFHLNDSNWLNTFFESLLDRRRVKGISADFYEPLGSTDLIFKSLINQIRMNKKLIPEPSSVPGLKKILRLTRQNEDLNNLLACKDTLIKAMSNSWSWKMTYPIRLAVGALKRLLG